MINVESVEKFLYRVDHMQMNFLFNILKVEISIAIFAGWAESPADGFDEDYGSKWANVRAERVPASPSGSRWIAVWKAE